MAIKAGQILHDAHGFVVDRIQTGGAGNLNIPEERINELGNFQTVATVRDIPDLSFDLESLDVSTEIEALLAHIDPTTVTVGQEIEFIDHKPIHIISPFKAGMNLYNIVRGLAIPYLTLENATYRFGTRANATQQFTLRGSSIYYINGTPYYERYTAATAGPYAFTNTALPHVSGGDTLYALSICEVRPDGSYRRLFFGDDYTNTAAGFTLTAAPTAGGTNNSVTTGSILHVVYGSATAASYPQTVHQGVSVKPAAVRGKDIDVYVGDTAATPTFTRWSSVQGFEVSWRVNLDNDEEFGNPNYVAQDYDTAEVGGNVTIRPRDPQELWAKIYQITNTPTGEIAGPTASVALPLELRINDPDTGTRLKTLYVPDARFTPPPIQGRVGQKLEAQFNFTSDSGVLRVYRGARP